MHNVCWMGKAKKAGGGGSLEFGSCVVVVGLTEETRKITSCEIPQTNSKWCCHKDA